MIKPIAIPRLTDLITFAAMTMSFAAIFAFGHGWFVGGWCLVLLAMFADASDGYWARRLSIRTTYGATLDSLVDVLTYLVAPISFFYFVGFHHPIYLLSYLILAGCGVFRLAIFTAEGFLPVEAAGSRLHYRGLPVFWISFLGLAVMELILLNGMAVVRVGLPISILIISALMIVDTPRYKPKSLANISIFLTVLAVILIVTNYLKG